MEIAYKLCTSFCPYKLFAPPFLVIGPNFRLAGNTGLDATAWYETTPPPPLAIWQSQH
jgi:hypothetical protein